MNRILTLFLFVFGFAFASQAYAQVVCQPIYGGGQTCVTVGNIAVNKVVAHPQTGVFVDNLGVNDPKFAPNQVVTFRITITNTGGTTISSVNVTDVFPQFVNFVSGPGSFNQTNKTLTFSAGGLNPGESREFTLQGKVVADNQLTQQITCVVNHVSVTADSMQAQDNSQLCIQKPQAVTKGGLPVMPPPKVKVTPPTGPELIPLISLLPAGLGGWYLRKFGGKK